MTSPTDITDFLRSTLALACNREADSLTPTMSLAELNVDSLTLVSVLAQIEAVYDLTLTEEDTLAMFEALCISDLAERLDGIVSR